jgi:hypothetical protein
MPNQGISHTFLLIGFLKVLMADTCEKDLDLRLSKKSLEFFKIHM